MRGRNPNSARSGRFVKNSHSIHIDRSIERHVQVVLFVGQVRAANGHLVSGTNQRSAQSMGDTLRSTEAGGGYVVRNELDDVHEFVYRDSVSSKKRST